MIWPLQIWCKQKWEVCACVFFFFFRIKFNTETCVSWDHNKLRVWVCGVETDFLRKNLYLLIDVTRLRRIASVTGTRFFLFLLRIMTVSLHYSAYYDSQCTLFCVLGNSGQFNLRIRKDGLSFSEQDRSKTMFLRHWICFLSVSALCANKTSYMSY